MIFYSRHGRQIFTVLRLTNGSGGLRLSQQELPIPVRRSVFVGVDERTPACSRRYGSAIASVVIVSRVLGWVMTR